jgi:hypothetical protein
MVFVRGSGYSCELFRPRKSSQDAVIRPTCAWCLQGPWRADNRCDQALQGVLERDHHGANLVHEIVSKVGSIAQPKHVSVTSIASPEALLVISVKTRYDGVLPLGVDSCRSAGCTCRTNICG